MKNLKLAAALAGLAVTLSSGTTSLLAQERPQRDNFDPEQFRQRMEQRIREQLGVTNDDEWKLINERIQKVTEARGFGAGGPMGFMGPRRGGPGGDNQPADQGRGRGFRGSASPEAQALQKAIDDKASVEEIKTKLAAYRQARKDREARLAKAREELKAVLSVRQEAAAVLLGLLE